MQNLNTFNVHGGHDAQGRGASGACSNIKNVGWFYESVEDRNVKDDVIDLLRKNEKTAYDCTVDAAGTQQDNLYQIVTKCNAHKVDRDISIHFNSGRDDVNGDGDNAGVEVWLYDDSDQQLVKEAERICANISKLGFDNRGVKFDKELYVLRNTKAKAMLIECCFVDDKDDVDLYRKVGSRAIAKAIVEGVLNTSINESSSSSNASNSKVYKIVTGGLGSREVAEKKAAEIRDLFNWYIEVKENDGNSNDFRLETGGFTGISKVEKKMNALQELTGWWMVYQEE
ncbi:N-acetylmuramoyl-L-alanine amidase [Clostridium perfringens]|nr:N-acetylmuramoyl-L-alanine amidase [Clostridium perfringens]